MLVFIILWAIGIFVIFWAMIGYPVSLIFLNKLVHKENEKNYEYEPTVSIMIVAHNEEKVIEQKLCNLLEIDYPKEKLSVLVALDYCTDATERITEEFIEKHPDMIIRIHKTKNHNGKTNAQNETQELCESEILVMTDANAMIEANAIRELVSSFTDQTIAYVSGQLKYRNTDNNNTAHSEGFYWKLDLMCRRIESKIRTITAGNGALYAVRNEYYIKISPIECHDSSFPIIYALNKKRAIYNPDALAYEKAGEVDSDEFKRKVRMNRGIIRGIMPDLRILNIFRYGWFSYFYFGHRTCRYLLWLAHIIALVVNVPLAINGFILFDITLLLQLIFYLIATIGWAGKSNNRLVKIITYYCMTIVAQCKGVVNVITGKSKPVWEKADSTR